MRKFFSRPLHFHLSVLPLQPILKNEVAMAAFGAYSLPIQGLKVGIHHFKYELDHAFFRHFEDSPVENGLMRVRLQLDKRSDMMLFDFVLEGHVDATCDRCTAAIQLPLEYERQLVVKYGEQEGDTEDEVVFISREASEFNVAKYLYEFTVLALPITNTYDCQSEPHPPCNFDVLKYLAPESDENQASGSVWDVLKKEFKNK